ncbi:MAG: efflux RND transporter periplasmic adaptor subunit [candidate division KSB1 bacterium]|nr:efflux RND transporter periplasmic adaptor subunit [candidate division KSB1 bacterium]
MRTIGAWLSGVVALALMSCARPRDDAWLGSGILEAKQVTIGARSAGELVGLFVDEGDTVAAEALVAVVDTSKLILQRTQLLAAKRELAHSLANASRAAELAAEQCENARKQYERMRTLAERGSLPQQQLESAELGYTAARSQLEMAKNNLAALTERAKQVEAQLELLQSQLEDARIRSPLAGVVVAKYVEQGELVAPGSPLLAIADMRDMWLKVYLPEPDLGKVSLGAKVVVRVDALPGEEFPGTVSWISPKAEFTPKNVQTRAARAELVFAVKVSVPNNKGRLLVGMPAEVWLVR